MSSSRREFMAAIGVGAGIAATGVASRALASPPSEAASLDAAAATSPEVGGYLGGIRAGARIDRWTVEAVHPLRMGAIPIVLRTATDARFQVDVLRRDDAEDAPRGVASTTYVSLFLSNRGDGSKPTDEEQGLGAMALASAIAQREAEGAAPPALLTLRERREQHPVGGYSVLT